MDFGFRAINNLARVPWDKTAISHLPITLKRNRDQPQI